MGTVVAICHRHNEAPPHLPITVTVRFDTYRGPTLSDESVTITPLQRTWFTLGGSCSCLQMPLKLAWAVTIHKVDKVVIDTDKKDSQPD